VGIDLEWLVAYIMCVSAIESELLYPPCTYLECAAVSHITDESGVSIRCLSVSAMVSTARHNVDAISTVTDVPFDEAQEAAALTKVDKAAKDSDFARKLTLCSCIMRPHILPLIG
jgi:hypothetical protein